MLIADNNGDTGIFIGISDLLLLGGPFANSGTFLIQATGNAGSGIAAPLGGRVASPLGTARFVLENNNTGLVLAGDSSALIVGGLNIQNNQVGLVADGAGDMTLVSIPPLPSAINNNVNLDVNLAFGTRSTFDGVDVGTVACDDTVLIRGSTTCP